MNGGNGDELILAGSGDDTIDGGLGNNILSGGEGDDTLKIAAPSDTHNFSNTFIGGSGNDRIEGASGADTYVYNLGDGNDVIVDKNAGYSKTDKLVFGEGITKANIGLQLAGDNLVVLVAHPDTGAVSTITIEGAISNNWRRIEQMVFADGTVIEGDWLDKLALVGTAADDNIAGTIASETIHGLAGNDVIDGGLGNNTLHGGEGDDTLKIAAPSDTHNFSNTFIGGSGNDRIEGASGADTYVYNLGDGNDVIVDKNAGYSKTDKLVFGEGITKANISLQRAGDNLVVLVAHPDTGAVSTITIEGAISNNWRRIEQMVFADGTVISGDWHSQLSSTSIGTGNNDVIAGSDRPDWLFGLDGNDNLDGGLGNNRLFGGAGDDTLKIVASPEQAKNFHTMFIGGIGNDRLEGNSGHDIYVFNLGDGQDRIRDSGGIDKVVFGAGIRQSHLQLQRTVDNHLVIQLLNDHGELSGDQITIQNAFEDSALVIERFEFADGNSVIIDVATTLNELALAQNWELTPSVLHDVDFYAVDAKVSNLIDALNAFESDGEAEAEAAFNTTIRFEEPIY